MVREKNNPADGIHRAVEDATKILNRPRRVNRLLQASKEKLNQLEIKERDVKGILGILRTFIRMIKAFMQGQYQIPWVTVLMVVAALIYFVSPLDMLPDFIPGVGYIDDFAVVLAIFKKIKRDIDVFRAWETAQ